MAKQSEGEVNRREFLKSSALIGGLSLMASMASCRSGPTQSTQTSVNENDGKSVAIVSDPGDAIAAAGPSQWAIGEMIEGLKSRGITATVYPTLDQAPEAGRCIVASGSQTALARELAREGGISIADAPESLGLARINRGKREIILAAGADARGLLYAITELTDRIKHAASVELAMESVTGISEKPANSVRGVMRLFVSNVEDTAWFHDRSFWQRYFSMLISQRFNRFNLALGLGYDTTSNLHDTYFFFAYPFLVSVPGYDVKVKDLSDGERQRNLESLKFISDTAAERGLHFQLGLWTHAYQWVDSPDANYVIQGLTPATQAAYSRDALHQLLEACPNISGVTFRVHGESGVPEGSYAFWKTIFDGAARTGRPIQIDLHAKGIDEPMINSALATGLPVNISPKFWAEHLGLPYHPASIREGEMPKAETTGQFALSSGTRSFLRYGYGDLLRDDRRYGVLHRIWPGTQRLLLWADPKFAAGYGRIFSFLGSAGVEIFEPLSFKGRGGSGLPGGRGAYADKSLEPSGGDCEKYLLTYRLWGRLTYNPDADADVWRRTMRRELGGDAEGMETAIGAASRILPLITSAHDPGPANYSYWPEVYTNMSIVDAAHPEPYTEAPAPKIFGNVTALDPQLFATINDYCQAMLDGQLPAKVSPLVVAQQLEDWSSQAFKILKRPEIGRKTASSSAAARRMLIDATITAGVGRFFAWKYRAAALFALFDKTGHEPARQAAVKAYQQARDAWQSLAATGDAAYVGDITFGPAAQLRGNWSARLPAIDSDIIAMQKVEPNRAVGNIPAERIEELMARVLARPSHSSIEVGHTPPASFLRGKAIEISIRVPAEVNSVRLLYRQVNQGQRYTPVAMELKGAEYSASIPEQATQSHFALQYYFEVRNAAGDAWLHPGFQEDFCGQPYYVLQAAV